MSRDPDARCSVCDARLSRVDAGRESRCIRKADGWPAFRDDVLADETPAAKARHDARFEAEAEFREQERERLAELEAEDAA